MEKDCPTASDLADLGKLLKDRQDEFLDILCYISTYRAAVDEISHAIETLHGASDELANLGSNRIEALAAYLPANVILFSYVLYAIVPSVYSNRLIVRPSLRGREVSWSIHKRFSELISLPIEFDMHHSRNAFWTDKASAADVVVFTGKCENAAEVREQIAPGQMFLYFGSGVNPIVIGPNADLEHAIDDVVRIRVHNSGQDCLCPDLILVHESIRTAFVSRLIHRVSTLVHGSLRDPLADYSNLVYPNIAEFCFDFVQRNRGSIVHGGLVNILDRHVQPTVVLRDISALTSRADVPEFFAPVFNVAIYSDTSEISGFINSDFYKPHAMGASLYGANELSGMFAAMHMVTIEASLISINYGNKPFGGYGTCASYVQYNGSVTPKPLLVSQEVNELLGYN